MDKIVNLYDSIGPKLISERLQSEGYNVSRYLIVRFLKKQGIYQKYQKGIGDISIKNCSINRRGENNPQWNRKASTQTRQKMSDSMRKNAKDRDTTTRTFYNNKTGETFVGTAYNFREQYRISYFDVRKLIKNLRKTTHGWMLKHSV